MMCSRNVSPSIRGISMSSVMTSGTCWLMRSAATNGSDAVPITSICESAERTSLRDWRTTAESSTISTRIFLALIIPASHSGYRPEIHHSSVRLGNQPDELDVSVAGVEANLSPKRATHAGGGDHVSL